MELRGQYDYSEQYFPVDEEVLTLCPPDQELFLKAMKEAATEEKTGSMDTRFNIHTENETPKYLWSRTYYKSIADHNGRITRIIGRSFNIDEDKNLYLFFVTLNGLVKKTSIEEFKNIRQSGKIAINLKDEDQLVAVKLTKENEEILVAASNGKLIRFNENDVRPMGRTASGVKGINVDGSHVVGMTTNGEGQYIMAISENGYGKMSPIEDYRESHRGGKGVKTINTTEKTGQLVALRAVNGDEDLLIMTSEGIMIRLPMEQVKLAGRNTQGVRLIKVAEGSIVSSVEVVSKSEEEIEENEVTK